MRKKVKLKKNLELIIFDNKDLYLKELVTCFKKDLRQNGIKNFIFPGGKTPNLFLKKLSNEPINWKNIKISLTDERLSTNNKVSYTQSNFKNLQKNLLCRLSDINQPEYLPLPIQNEKYSENKYGKFIKNSCVYLGAGLDGHVASIFRGDYNISDKKNIFFTKKKHFKFNRVSWTFKGLLNSNKIVLLLGKQKKPLILKILNNTKNSNLPYLKLIQKYAKEIKIMYCNRVI